MLNIISRYVLFFSRILYFSMMGMAGVMGGMGGINPMMGMMGMGNMTPDGKTPGKKAWETIVSKQGLDTDELREGFDNWRRARQSMDIKTFKKELAEEKKEEEHVRLS